MSAKIDTIRDLDDDKTFSEIAAEDNDYNRSYEDPFYPFGLNDEAIDQMDRYLDILKSDEGHFRKELINHPGSPGVAKKDKFRVCDIHPVREGSTIHDIGKSLFNVINDRNYQFDINTYEFQILRYNLGGNFEWHCDYGIAPNKNVWRKLSMSIQLSDPEDYEGGELILVDYFNRHCQIDNQKGDCVIFDSRCPHKASHITKGTRYVLVGWASGPKMK